MRSFLRRTLLRLGLTGTLLFHAGWLLALSFGLLVGLAWWGGGRTIRDEMQKTQRVRVLDWASRHLEALEKGDRWALAKAVEELSQGPYVLYAGIFDRAGSAVAHSGDEGASGSSNTLGFIHILRSEEIEAHAAAPPGEKPEPLAGLITTPEEESPGATFRQRFGAVLGDLGNRSEGVVGFVEITLDTAPLDRLAARVMQPLVVLAAVLFVAGMGGTLLLVRRVTAPLRLLREQADLLAAGSTDLDFHKIPRTLDEVGDLVAHFSVMSSGLQRWKAGVEEEARQRETAATDEVERLRRKLSERDGESGS